MFRRLVAALAALLIAVAVVRNAAVDALADTSPRTSARVWSGHPQVELQNSLLDIAEAMRDRQQINPKVFALLADAARKAPLDARPYLVRGVQAQVGGNFKVAEQAFLAAQMRDPRSLPAAYFLASYYLRSGNAGKAVEQIGLVARLAPGGAQAVAPYIASLARDRANWPLLKALLNSDAQLRESSLEAMAADPANADAVTALATQSEKGPPPSWLPSLLNGLVSDGQYAKARSIWVAQSHVSVGVGALIYDPGFADASSPPPFNWQLTSSTVGLAERQAGARVHVLFYGQEDGALLSQLLVLPPGTYKLAMKLLPGSNHADALVWQVRCAQGNAELGRSKLSSVAINGMTFTVPTDCPAQNLSLAGNSSDMPQQSDVILGGLQLTRGGRGV